MLSETQTDALKELFNIAFSRTGAALSQLTNQRVKLDMPDISIYPLSKLSDNLMKTMRGELSSIHQLFSGAVSGDAMLLLKTDDAKCLADLLADQQISRSYLDASSREVLIEVGNILLNSCLGVFGNILQVHITFSVPHLERESLDDLFQSIVIDKKGMSHALVTCTQFHLCNTAVNGSLVIVLGVTSLEYMLKAIDEWIARTSPIVAKTILNLESGTAEIRGLSLS
jgi:chemotaxis protein CheC